MAREQANARTRTGDLLADHLTYQLSGDGASITVGRFD
jgi:hypothetical protein